MPTVEVLVDGKVVSSRPVTFDSADLSKEVSDSIRGKNIRYFDKRTSRERRTAKNGEIK